ncbi:uncharacterized protein LACBIDRAFT_303145 [Laccaria bicolor S238N-H82]|uniref:Predicted protein n=1 Tax=Laccaria bicolor (strain S238N-H82 / ATCC MYA-4686) TaxID=486041 RepID=B0DJ06_LACBS|nr:uncharacterized protein LACBIDRAFT_303138 [Laccaria bicolor S238N-H82]XP_001883996.1 uncharacterized protein LACBIDRAFT_303145 [Laccaria bicolor S238N-H82]EDR05435.1 predicted protein [Laccaria bicolor S238N-H82]EDR05438.1 predicted protein [Laccaria bicolor S238N-H82]|eukprot:XP_001883993.1 predicted protein [Laccaria bicolor S238N-H82]
MARHFGCEFIETLAKTAQNVERLFRNLVRALRQARESSVPTKIREKKPGMYHHVGDFFLGFLGFRLPYIFVSFSYFVASDLMATPSIHPLYP